MITLEPYRPYRGSTAVIHPWDSRESVGVSTDVPISCCLHDSMLMPITKWVFPRLSRAVWIVMPISPAILPFNCPLNASRIKIQILLCFKQSTKYIASGKNISACIRIVLNCAELWIFTDIDLVNHYRRTEYKQVNNKRDKRTFDKYRLYRCNCWLHA